MNTLRQLIDDIDFAVLKTSDKEIYEAYQQGKLNLRKNITNDVDFIHDLLKSFFEHYNQQITSLPEPEREIELLKIKLAHEQLDSIIKIFSYNKNYLDKNLFLFYTLAYVNDIVRRHSSNKEPG